MRKIYLFFISLSLVFTANAQFNANYVAQQFVVNKAASIGFSTNDLGYYVISSSYFNKTSGTQLVYLNRAIRACRCITK